MSILILLKTQVINLNKKNMKKYNKILCGLILGMGLIFTSCVKDLTNVVYSGPDLIEFAPTKDRVFITTTAPKRDSVAIQLIGKQRSTPITITYTIDPASTAVAGTDYTILTPSPVVIDPNTSLVFVKFIFNKVSSTKTLILNLGSGDNVTLSENFKIFTYSLR